jgi:magnesium chelatase family protein
MDRIDIHMDVPAVEYKDLSNRAEGKSSKEILQNLKKARDIQKERFKGLKIHNNANMTGRHIKKFCEIDNDSDRLLETAMEKLGLSARAHSRILKIARTIADVDGSEKISADHVAEAIQYRSLDRKVLK